MKLSVLSLSFDIGSVAILAGGSPPPVYTPATQFNDKRNSMYAGALYSI